MSIERTDPQTNADTASQLTESNGAPGESSGALRREVVLLRARCSNLRHWCRPLLDDPASTGVLDERTVADLRTTVPEVAESEGQTVVALVARGGSVPPNHPLAPPDDPSALGAARAALTVEHERLRKAFFALYDHLYPDDNLTEEYFLALQGDPVGKSISEMIAEFEREYPEGS
jgi:hypothetical protein